MLGKVITLAVALGIIAGCSVIKMEGESNEGIRAELSAVNQKGEATLTVMKEYIKVTSDAKEVSE